jgi:hypothetical protein
MRSGTPRRVLQATLAGVLAGTSAIAVSASWGAGGVALFAGAGIAFGRRARPGRLIVRQLLVGGTAGLVALGVRRWM